MTVYEFERHLFTSGDWTGCYDIDNPARGTHLAVELQAALPGRAFFLRCDGPVCLVEHQEDLTPAEVATQAAAVQAHQQNT